MAGLVQQYLGFVLQLTDLVVHHLQGAHCGQGVLRQVGWVDHGEGAGRLERQQAPRQQGGEWRKTDAGTHDRHSLLYEGEEASRSAAQSRPRWRSQAEAKSTTPDSCRIRLISRCSAGRAEAAKASATGPRSRSNSRFPRRDW
ncbi:hypothetical protein D3C80_1527260 [compost metagenome]